MGCHKCGQKATIFITSCIQKLQNLKRVAGLTPFTDLTIQIHLGSCLRHYQHSRKFSVGCEYTCPEGLIDRRAIEGAGLGRTDLSTTTNSVNYVQDLLLIIVDSIKFLTP